MYLCMAYGCGNVELGSIMARKIKMGKKRSFTPTSPHLAPLQVLI